MARRRPTVTEQIAHTELCIEVERRKEAERAAELAAENLPEGWEYVHSGHYPPEWVENRKKLPLTHPVVAALAAGMRVVHISDNLCDAEREYYSAALWRAYRELAGWWY